MTEEAAKQAEEIGFSETPTKNNFRSRRQNFDADTE